MALTKVSSGLMKPDNNLELEYTSQLGTTSVVGAATGYVVRTNYYDANVTAGSGATFKFTGVTTLGKAGNVPDADGYFYDAVGRQFEVVGSPVNVLWFGAVGDDVADDTFAIKAAMLSRIIYLPPGVYKVNGALEHDVTNTLGMRIFGSGSKITTIKQYGAFDTLAIKRTNGTGFVDGNTVEKLTIDNNNIGVNCLYLYAARFNRFYDLELKNGTGSGIYIDGNGTINPDLTATALTVIDKCDIVSNSIGINNLYNNNAPLTRVINTRILNNDLAGVVHNSSYFTFQNCSVSFNGQVTASAIGGIICRQGGTFASYTAKGLVIETTELDSNYPTQFYFESGSQPVIKNSSIQMSTQYYTLPTIPVGFIGRIGTNDLFRVRGLRMEQCRVSLVNNDLTSFAVGASALEIYEGALSTELEGLEYSDNLSYAGLGTDYVLVNEQTRTGSVNHSAFDVPYTYAKLSNQQNISFNRQLIAFNLQRVDGRLFRNDDKTQGFYMLDDTVLIIPTTTSKRVGGTGVNIGTFQLVTNNPGSFSGMGFFRAQAGPQCTSAFAGTLTTLTTGVLTGTTGTDGRFTVAAADNGNLYFENRSGGAIYINVFMNNDLIIIDE